MDNLSYVELGASVVTLVLAALYASTTRGKIPEVKRLHIFRGFVCLSIAFASLGTSHIARNSHWLAGTLVFFIAAIIIGLPGAVLILRGILAPPKGAVPTDKW
ncbi:MAG: hypothetical protein ABFD64_11375 [Armatimonadota bacterium]